MFAFAIADQRMQFAAVRAALAAFFTLAAFVAAVMATAGLRPSCVGA